MNDEFAPRTFFDIQPNPDGISNDFRSAPPQEAVIAPDVVTADVESIGSLLGTEVVEAPTDSFTLSTAPEVVSPAVVETPVTVEADVPTAPAPETPAAETTTVPVTSEEPETPENVEIPTPKIVLHDETPVARDTVPEVPEEEERAAEKAAEEPAPTSVEKVATGDRVEQEWGITNIDAEELAQLKEFTTAEVAKAEEKNGAFDEALKALSLNPTAAEKREVVQAVYGDAVDAENYENDAIMTVAYGADSPEFAAWQNKQKDPNTTLGQLHNDVLNALRREEHKKHAPSLQAQINQRFLNDLAA